MKDRERQREIDTERDRDGERQRDRLTGFTKLMKNKINKIK